MTQKALKVVMDALDDLLYWDNGKPEYDEARKALQVGKQALAQTQEPVPPPWWTAVENILNEYGLQAIDFVADFKQALAQTQEPVAIYGYCPECGAKGVMRERRPNGNDKCANGHTYPSSTSTPPQRSESFGKPSAWVDLTDDDKHEIELRAGITEDDDGYIVSQVFKLTEAKLKEKNT